MCTPQIQQAIAGAQAAGIIPGQQVNPQQDIAEGTVSAGIQSVPPAGFDPRMNDPRYASQFGAAASSISEMFDPRTGQVVRQVGPPKEMQIVPITKEEFDGPVMSDSIRSIPQHMMRKQYAPMPELPIQRKPTVGELLGIKPGSVPGI